MELYPTCGCIPFKYLDDGSVQVLMVLNDGEEKHWEFPKGKIESNESEKETALRELKEETGLEGIIVSDERVYFEFDCVVKGNAYHKSVTYFFCEVSNNQEVVLQEEELGKYDWLPLDEMEAKATYPSMKDAAQKARIFLSSSK